MPDAGGKHCLEALLRQARIGDNDGIKRCFAKRQSGGKVGHHGLSRAMTQR